MTVTVNAVVCDGRGPLRALVQQRNLTSYREFRREFDRVARRLDRNASGHVPAPATVQLWMAGQLPRDMFRRRVLEAMFPELAGLVPQQIDVAAAPGSPRALGEALKQARTVAGVSQGELARECLLDRTVVSKAEAGQRMPSRRFWAEADIALAADGVLVGAYDRWAQAQDAPRSSVRVLARHRSGGRMAVVA
ncbi:helix-turn-helix transcriptional regulator [Nocardia sp. NPDC019395]|uniref:helix-turn-helix domain-containing protein n=1 Tax=Nocardia sp. NPDC019395 TaxID=3154686 RepID=UPI0033C16D43